ncbi:MAG: ATP-binding protein [Syntrophaceae bacterium]
METNLQGRLRNTSLPYNHGLLPLYEAIVNSIHSIDEAGLSSDNGKIQIEIIRRPQASFDLNSSSPKRGHDANKDILGFKVTDNGSGFNDPNMKSFLTLDSQYKADKGGRGIGRLLWLKAFKKVNVESIYQDDEDNFKLRKFTFTADSGVSEQEECDVNQEAVTLTSVHLDGFDKKYREVSNKTTVAIANSLFEHSLWYFVREGGAPEILIRDDEECISLSNVYDKHMISSALTEKILVKDKEFDLTHIKLRANSSLSNVIAFCAAKRLVREESITGKIPGLYGKLQDESGEFVYACYVTSSFLDETVRPERTDFDIDEKHGALFAETEISFSEIKDAILTKVADHLSRCLEENKTKARDRIEAFVSKKAPRYRPILSRIPKDRLSIDPNISDKELDLTLHKFLTEVEEQLLSTGHEIMNKKDNEGFTEYQNRIQEYLKTAEDIKKSDLANYVSHRRVILDLLEKAIKRDQDGKYIREDLIHELIIPMRKDSTEVVPDGMNLWLLDERLTFHDYLASDKTIASMPITGSNVTKEPDICSLHVTDNPILVSEEERPPFASLTIVEIKRPMRNDASEGEEKDPIEQCLGYLQRIREGKVTTKNGRPLGNSQALPGYCYIVCDLTQSIIKRCAMHDLTITSDGLGYFGYKKTYQSYIEVISFDQLVNSAKQRNRAFFDKLGLPTT